MSTYVNGAVESTLHVQNGGHLQFLSGFFGGRSLDGSKNQADLEFPTFPSDVINEIKSDTMAQMLSYTGVDAAVYGLKSKLCSYRLQLYTQTNIWVNNRN